MCDDCAIPGRAYVSDVRCSRSLRPPQRGLSKLSLRTMQTSLNHYILDRPLSRNLLARLRPGVAACAFTSAQLVRSSEATPFPRPIFSGSVNSRFRAARTSERLRHQHFFRTCTGPGWWCIDTLGNQHLSDALSGRCSPAAMSWSVECDCMHNTDREAYQEHFRNPRWLCTRTQGRRRDPRHTSTSAHTASTGT
jgi:hypothetical protein